MSDSPMAGGRAGAVESPVTLSRTRSGSNTVRPQPVTEQSLMESVAGQFFLFFFTFLVFKYRRNKVRQR